MQEDIIYADPEYRKKFIRNFIILAVVGMLIIAFLLPYARQYLFQQPHDIFVQILKYFTLGVFIIPLIISIFIIRYALICIKQRRFPPAGAKVLKDTPILYDDSAVRRAAILLLIAGLLIVVSFTGISFTYVMYRFLT